MKRCPTCHREYADDSLRFCLQDGSALVTVPDANSSDATLVMDSSSAQGAEAPPTEILYDTPAPTVRGFNDAPTLRRDKPAATVRQQGRPTQNEFQDFAGAAVAAPRQRSTSTVIAITVLATVLLLGLGGLITWLVMRNSGSTTMARTENTGSVITSNTTNSTNGSVGNMNAQPRTTPTPTLTPTPLSSPSTTPTPGNDTGTARREVMSALDGWTETMRRADLEGHMAYYAATLHTYYNASNVDISRVRANVARAFSKYSTFDVRLTNMQIEVDPAGTSAVATFDKTFVFGGNGTYSGSGLNRFWLEKIGGRWLITGEKDLKTYYINNN